MLLDVVQAVFFIHVHDSTSIILLIYALQPKTVAQAWPSEDALHSGRRDCFTFLCMLAGVDDLARVTKLPGQQDKLDGSRRCLSGSVSSCA
jgi:hypothetical protein